jgi:hypothetical protein
VPFERQDVAPHEEHGEIFRAHREEHDDRP